MNRERYAPTYRQGSRKIRTIIIGHDRAPFLRLAWHANHGTGERVQIIPTKLFSQGIEMSTLFTFATITCVLCISIGQLLFKKAATTLPDTLSVTTLLLNGWLMASLILYALTTLGWVWVLRHAPLHLAYPFMGLAFLIVPTLAWLFLGEPLHWRTLAGGVLIMAGVALASAS
jgi:drug/metabolite transporter (DMT)-like permease